jgi:hypothetical protein
VTFTGRAFVATTPGHGSALSVRTRFNGVLEYATGGSRIEGHFSPDALTIIVSVLALWIAALVLVAVSVVGLQGFSTVAKPFVGGGETFAVAMLALSTVIGVRANAYRLQSERIVRAIAMALLDSEAVAGP